MRFSKPFWIGISFVLAGLVSSRAQNQPPAFNAVVANGDLVFSNHMTPSGNTKPFVALIGSNAWMFSKGPSDPHEEAESYDGTTRIWHLVPDYNPPAGLPPGLLPDPPPNHPHYQADLYTNEISSISDNALLWFALGSAHFLHGSNELVMRSFFPGFGAQNYMYDRTNRYICRIPQFLANSGLPRSADFIASSNLWQEEMQGREVKWPFQDGYVNVHYQVLDTRTVGDMEFPIRFVLHCYVPHGWGGLTHDGDELYTVQGVISSLEGTNVTPVSFSFSTTEPTRVVDLRLPGKKATYDLESFASVPDLNDPVVQQAFAKAPEIHPRLRQNAAGQPQSPILPTPSASPNSSLMWLSWFSVVPLGLFGWWWFFRRRPSS